MRPTRKTMLLVVGVVAVLAVLGVGLTQQQDSPPSPKLTPAGSSSFKSFAAPATRGTTLAGRRFDLADLRGKPVVLNFWASWCEGCRAEAPELRHLDGELGARARLVGVDVDDHADRARAFARRHGWRYQHLVSSSDLAFDYGVVGFPSTVIVDGSGRVVDKITGATTADQIMARLDRLS